MNKRQQQPPTAVQVIEAFKAAMLRSMGAAPERIKPEGITRFDDPEGKRGNKACYCQLFTDSHPAGYFGNWRTQHRETWAMGGKERMSATERQRLHIRMAKAKEEYKRQQEKQQRAVKARASGLWLKGHAADPQHPYLIAKQVPPGIARQLPGGAFLMLPLYGFEGELWSLQFIAPDCGKKNQSGGRKKGCFIPVQMPDNARDTLICEGWATGQTLAGYRPDARVLAALDADNLLSVARQARQRWPETKLVICGDDDRTGKTNTGAIAARAAANATGAVYMLPDWPADAPEHLSDFNDLANWIKAGGRYAS